MHPIFLSLICVIAASTALIAEPPEWSGSPERTIELKTLPGMMKFNEESLVAIPGEKVKIVIHNDDDLEHNWVLLDLDAKDPKGTKFAEECIAMGANGPAMAWTPNSPRVLAKSGMIGPEEQSTFYFVAPEKSGNYHFICSFPGHSNLMRGTLKVGIIPSPFSELKFACYEGDFVNIPVFSKHTPTRQGDAKLIDLKSVTDKKNAFAVLWEGTFEIPKTGNWQFSLGSDDGSRLSIDGELVIENGGIHPFKEIRKKEKLEKGVHTMRVAYFDASGAKGITLYASLKGQPDIIFSSEKIRGPKRRKKKPNPIILKPVNPGEAITHRTFLSGSQPRSIAVGYPGSVNLAWNADTMNLDLLWRGGFINVAPHWIGRGSGSAVAGFDKINIVDGMSLQVLESGQQPWISFSKAQVKYERDKPQAEINQSISVGIQHPDYNFKGYTMDAKRFPTFIYDFKKIAVTDTFKPSSEGDLDSITRTIKFSGPVDRHTYLLVAAGSEYSKISQGWISVAKGFSIKINGARPTIRSAAIYDSDTGQATSAKRNEILVPVPKDSTLEIVYRWDNPVSGKPKS